MNSGVGGQEDLQPRFGVGTDGIVRGGVLEVEAWLAGLDEQIACEIAQEAGFEKCPFDEQV